MRDWYRPNDDTPAAAPARDITWLDILPHWNAVWLDLSEVHGIDLYSGILEQRSWLWLEPLILDMVHRGPRLSAALTAQLTAPEGGTRGS